MRLLFRWLLPLVFPLIIKRLMKKYGQGFGSFNPREENPVDITPKFNTPKSSAKSKDDEYIDFEELK